MKTLKKLLTAIEYAVDTVLIVYVALLILGVIGRTVATLIPIALLILIAIIAVIGQKAIEARTEQEDENN